MKKKKRGCCCMLYVVVGVVVVVFAFIYLNTFQVVFGVPFGKEIDMWSLGCILFEMYTGRPLFYTDTKGKLILQMFRLLGTPPSDVYKKSVFYKNCINNRSAKDFSLFFILSFFFSFVT